MLLDHARNTGIILIATAMAVAAWKSFARSPMTMDHDESFRPASTLALGGGAELTIPVEIVEAGEAPRLHEVRVTR